MKSLIEGLAAISVAVAVLLWVIILIEFVAKYVGNTFGLMALFSVPLFVFGLTVLSEGKK